MPVVKNSLYKAPICFTNNHLQTVFPTLFRRVKEVIYKRERITTPDNDFLDLDYSFANEVSDRIVILLHGLEGNSDRAYMKGMAKAFNKRGWDSVSVNLRGCSGEINRLSVTYHSGKTEDIHTVIKHVASKEIYKSLCLIGFSLGGNLALKYVGEWGRKINPIIKCAVGISAPCDLVASSIELHKLKNLLYAKRFLVTLIKKMKSKEYLHPADITRDYSSIKTLRDFDDNFTGPLNGFADAHDYWKKSSSINELAYIAVPTLIINAKDDPILASNCFPYPEADSNKKLYLEVPEKGGHVGFVTFGNNGEYWHETRSVDFAMINL